MYTIFPPPLQVCSLLNGRYWYQFILNFESWKLSSSVVLSIHKMSLGVFWVISQRLMILFLKVVLHNSNHEFDDDDDDGELFLWYGWPTKGV